MGLSGGWIWRERAQQSFSGRLGRAANLLHTTASSRSLARGWNMNSPIGKGGIRLDGILLGGCLEELELGQDLELLSTLLEIDEGLGPVPFHLSKLLVEG